MGAVLMMAGCKGQPGAMRIESAEYADTAKQVNLRMHVEAPVADTPARAAMRSQLFGVLKNQLENLSYDEEGSPVNEYEGNGKDLQKVTDFYGGQAFGILQKLAADDLAMLEPNTDWMPVWDYDLSITLVTDTTRYAVFNSQNYIYMGGAHGGITGAGCLTFDQTDGHLVEKFLKEGCTEQMQPLLIKGVKSYFAGFDMVMTTEELLEHLFIENDIIPLPQLAPYPAGDGLCFVYQQYEIAAYAEGMPSFVLSAEELEPFLTEEAANLLRR